MSAHDPDLYPGAVEGENRALAQRVKARAGIAEVAELLCVDDEGVAERYACPTCGETLTLDTTRDKFRCGAPPAGPGEVGGAASWSQWSGGGGCGASGDVIALVMLAKGVGFRQACAWLDQAEVAAPRCVKTGDLFR